MDGFINSKTEKQAIYEIYRACRLCGAGAGYKMPIIQSVVNLDGAEVELKQKISDCVQIEVHQNDKMPPLICELCVDKVNDFYEFLEMCRQTNKRTRLRLGLPPQTLPRGAPDAGDCILGITEPVYLNEDSNEPLSKSSSKKFSKPSKGKKEESKKLSINTKSRVVKSEARSLRSKQPSPPRLRGTKRSHDDDKPKMSEPPKSILKKKEFKPEDTTSNRTKKLREKDIPVKKEEPKKVKIQAVTSPARTTRTSPKIKTAKRPKSPPPPLHTCKICKLNFDNGRSLNNHMRRHPVKQEKKPIKKEPESTCAYCKKSYPKKLILSHKCSAREECDACGRIFMHQKSLMRHISICAEKKKKEVYIPPKVRRILKPLQVRISRCDPLLGNGEHHDVSGVAFDYGLDKTCIYPYISNSLRIKCEPGYMVNISDDAFDAAKYVHWDSDESDSDTELMENSRKTVDSLTTLSLKTIFSMRCLGKVPRKRRKIREEKAFDSILNVSEFDSDLRQGINDIINSLDDKKDKDDSLFGDDELKPQSITNNDFDSLFGNDNHNDSTQNKNSNEQADNVKESSNKEINEISSVIESNVEENIVNKDTEVHNKVVVNDSTNDNNTNKVEENTEKVRTSEEITGGGNIEEESESKDNSEKEILGDNEENLNERVTEKSEENEFSDNNEVSEVSNDTLAESRNEENVETQNDKIESEVNSNETKNDDVNDRNVNEKTVNENVNIVVKSNKESLEDSLSKIVGDSAESKIDETNSHEKHVNGDDEKFNIDDDDLEDLTDGEMDDNRLMEALDAQIGENENGETKNGEVINENRETQSDKVLLEDLVPASVRSNDLESISDDEFNMND